MPTILELFRGSTFDTDVDSKSQEGKGTTFSQIKSFAEQELTGVRVKSAVELNNPLIYGNEATRIALRSTPEKDTMIESKKPDGAPKEGEGGLIGAGLNKITKGKVNSLNQLRNKVNSALGVPQTLIPSSYINSEGLDDPNLGVQSGYKDRLIKIKKSGEGTFVGGLLSGGNPKTIGQQAAGKLITEGKKKVREALFKNNPFKKKDDPESTDETTTKDKPEVIENTKEATYSEQAKKNQLTGKGTYLKYEPVEKQLGKLRVAPSYTSGKEKVGNDELKKQSESNDGLDPKRGGAASFEASSERYSNKDGISKVFETKGFRNDADKINQSGIYKEEGMNAEVTKLNDGELDFVPLKFKNVKTNEVTNFRGTITGLSETISPSWDSAKFSGNPFDFYTYTGVSRNVTFNFTVYPMNAYELVNNWTKLGFLTSLCYPLAYQGGDLGSVSAPFIFFTLGDMYKNRFSYIDSLQYTIPDTSNWQMDADVAGYDPKLDDEGSGRYFSKFGVNNPIKPNKNYKLPHLIEVAITIQLVEARANTEDRGKLYSFKPNTY